MTTDPKTQDTHDASSAWVLETASPEPEKPDKPSKEELAALLADAMEHHQAGRLDQAETLYMQILKRNPTHGDALQYMGVLAHQTGKSYVGLNFLRKAIALNPREGSPYNNLGNILKALGKLDSAIDHYKQALRYSPNSAEIACNLGNALQQGERLEEALATYRKALQLKPEYAQALVGVGYTLYRMGRLEDALATYRDTLRVYPDHAQTLNNMGLVLHAQGRLPEAFEQFEQATRLNPDYAEAYGNMGAICFAQGKAEEAQYYLERALGLKPDFADAYYNLGRIFQDQGRIEKAEFAYQQAIRLKPSHTDAHNNLGVLCERRQHFAEALGHYEAAIQTNPATVDAHWNRSLVLLRQGDYVQGWPEYEWRLQRPGCRERSFGKPMWDGSPLAGKRILVVCEQGFGDTIQFARYLPMLKAQGAHVILECPAELVRLFSGCAAVEEVKTQALPNTPANAYDAYVYLMSLPALFQTTIETIPPADGLLSPDPAVTTPWQKRFETLKGINVGLVWAGSQEPPDRSCSLAQYAPLLTVPHVTFYALQKGPAAAEAEEPCSHGKLINLDTDITDFADTAAILQQLDLVITVDTAVAHLAATLQRPTWVLLPHVADFRWLTGREDSPWYPGMRLFRQPRRGDWEAVIQAVAAALETFVYRDRYLKKP